MSKYIMKTIYLEKTKKHCLKWRDYFTIYLFIIHASAQAVRSVLNQ